MTKISVCEKIHTKVILMKRNPLKLNDLGFLCYLKNRGYLYRLIFLSLCGNQSKFVIFKP